MFSDDTAQPLDFLITTIEPNIPQDMYCNQVVLGNAFFGSDEIKERKNGQVAIKIGTTLDNSDVTTWLFMELHESRRSKLADRARKGRGICVHGYIRGTARKATRHLTEQSLRMTSQLVSARERTNGSSKATGNAQMGTVPPTWTRRRTTKESWLD